MNKLTINIGGIQYFNTCFDIIDMVNKSGLNKYVKLNIYDTIKHSIFEGGRPHNFEDTRPVGRIDLDMFEKIDILNTMNIGFNLVCSNRFVEEHQLDNKRFNKYLEVLNQSKLNGVIIFHDYMNDYIRDNFPNIRRICSVTRCYFEGRENDLSYIAEKLEKYDIVVVSNELSNIDNVSKTFIFDTNRLEYLVADGCLYNCKFKDRHYKSIDTVNYNNYYNREVKDKILNFCSIAYGKHLDIFTRWGEDDIIDVLKERDLPIKLSTRTSIINLPNEIRGVLIKMRECVQNGNTVQNGVDSD